MSIVLSNRRDFTLGNFLEVSWSGKSVEFAPSAIATMTRSRDAFMSLIDSDEDVSIYGVTSGYGSLAKVRFNPEERRTHAAALTHVPASSFGDALPDRVVRGIVFARLANFVEGHAAITADLAERVAAMLSKSEQPAVPALGNGGAGEIQALGWLFEDIKNTTVLAEKESLALVNGSPCAAALLSDSVLAAERRLALALKVFALSAEAISAPLDAYAPELDALWDDPYQTEILQQLRALLDAGSSERRSYQAPVSWRILPRVLGHASRTVEQARDIASRSLCAITDNPIFLPPSEDHPKGVCISTGGFHNGSAYPALDDLAACWADLALLADRHVSKLMDGAVSGLPHMLLPEGANPYCGEHAFLGCFGMSAAGYSEQARQAAQRTFLPGTEGGAFGANDVGVPTFQAWRKEREAARCLDANLAILAGVASQAMQISDRAPPPALSALLDMVRETFPPPQPTDLMARKMEELYLVFSGLAYTA